jgi:pimeloyl-ACP methyl ester carboxylesterase
MFAKTNFADEVRGLETPYLVMVGENDADGLNEAAMQETFLAWHPNAELVVMNDCGHYPMQESPPRFATVIENFLRKQIEAAASA